MLESTEKEEESVTWKKSKARKLCTVLFFCCFFDDKDDEYTNASCQRFLLFVHSMFVIGNFCCLFIQCLLLSLLLLLLLLFLLVIDYFSLPVNQYSGWCFPLFIYLFIYFFVVFLLVNVFFVFISRDMMPSWWWENNDCVTGEVMAGWLWETAIWKRLPVVHLSGFPIWLEFFHR